MGVTSHVTVTHVRDMKGKSSPLSSKINGGGKNEKGNIFSYNHPRDD